MLLLTFVALLVLTSALDNPNSCGQWPTCAICLQHNLCGWCSTNVIYEDGTLGPHCAGKPENPDNPPPGFKKWICPKDYQNKACYGYVCDPTNYQCVSSGAPGKGVPLAQCQQTCFPPTYICNGTTFQCDQTTPGHGTDKPSCEATCQNNLYICTNDAKCIRAPPGTGGSPKADCLSSCRPSNSTPTQLIGDYRGLEVSSGYIKGEWQAKITQSSVTITRPDGTAWAKGQIFTFRDQLWIQTDSGLRRGLYSTSFTPEVEALTWALGSVGGDLPASFPQALLNNTVFVLFKCLNSAVCKFSVANAFAHIEQLKRQSVIDPCMVYPDCQSCVDSGDYCGWCSVNVVYNGSIAGRQCAGVNKTITHATFNCTGSFSIESCLVPSPTPVPAPVPSPVPTPPPASTGGKTTGTTTGSPDKYTCDPISLTCKKSNDGIPLQVCK
eukprot:TRINITY_DN52_c0_g2_i4.p1 TRINITY_DN52_c0_g2~~TRINITY_DN52_c0_g2_i4.p1  ORF type:complete len:439 (-),score=55.55 TRINITY_DN52_c0_g2_i4:758-2074(-)